MIRVLTILATLVALAVSAAPVASAGTSKKLPPQTLKNAMVTTFGVKARPDAASFFLDIGTAETLDLNSVPPKPPGLGTRSGGEVETGDVFAKPKPKPLSLNTFGGNDTLKPKLAVFDHGITQGQKPPPQGVVDPITGADLSGKQAKPNARNNGNGFTHTLEDAIIVSLKR